MTDITEEQRQAIRELNAWANARGGSLQQAIFALTPLLPSELTNPQPVLPTEPGVVIEGTVADGERTVLFRLAGQNMPRPWIDELANRWGEDEIMEWTRRLVPERPQITREQVAEALGEANSLGVEPGAGVYIDALHAALVNGAGL